jgi:hypothetical protein
VGSDDPEKVENPIIVSLPETDDPVELAPAVAEVVGSPDTARFDEEVYAQSLASVATDVPALNGDQAYSPGEWSEQITRVAWSADPWADRAKAKGTDEFTAQKVVKKDNSEFLDVFAPESEVGSAEVRDWLEGEGLVTMQVQGALVRQYTNDDGTRMQADMGTVSFTVALLCPSGGDCRVFMVLPAESVEEG